MNIATTGTRNMPAEEYAQVKAAEMAEMQGYMDACKESPDPRIMYRWRRAVTDLKNMLETSAEIYGDKALFLQKFDKDKPFQEISYKQTLNDVNALGTALIDLGLKAAHIGVIGRNCYEWAESYYAIVGGTGVVVPLDKELSEEELKQLTIKGELTVVITVDERHYIMFKNIMAGGDTGLKYIIHAGLDEDEDKENGLLSWHKVRAHGYELVEQGNREYIDAQIVNTDLTAILFTSGTTGVSKGVMLSHKNIASNVMLAQTALDVRVDDIFFSVLPIHHAYECTATLIEATYCGATIAFCQGLKYILKDIQEVRPTMLLAVPAIYENFYSKIMKNVKSQGKDKLLNTVFKVNRVTKKIGLDLSKKAAGQIIDLFGGRMRTLIVGGAAIDGAIMDFFGDLGFVAVQGYGLSEMAPMTALNPDKPKYIINASAGRMLPFTDAKIEDKNEEGVGEICFRGPNMMLGYYKDEDATNAAIKDGWFYTGDLGYLDENNYVFITGRKKNVIITGNGKNVYPEELEFYAMKSPYIEECMVWGDESSTNPRSRGIYITLRVNQEEIEEALGKDYTDEQVAQLIDGEIDKANDQLPLFKQINHIVIRKREFDKTTGLKIKRFVEDNKLA